MKICLLLAATFLATAGCSTPKMIRGAEPISPPMPTDLSLAANRFPEIATLTPEFQWTDIREVPRDTFDICVWKPRDRNMSEDELRLMGGYKSDFANWGTGSRENWGEPIYCRERISKARHKIEVHLEPVTKYYWSVRVRSTSKTFPWASYSRSNYAVIAADHVRNIPFGFTTPNAQKSVK